MSSNGDYEADMIEPAYQGLEVIVATGLGNWYENDGYKLDQLQRIS